MRRFIPLRFPHFQLLHDIEAEMRQLEIQMAHDASDEVLNRYAELQIEFEHEEGFYIHRTRGSNSFGFGICA
jgi:hypothetical protein